MSHYGGKVLKAGAGVQLMDAYKAARDVGLVTVGGTCPTVGLTGGYTQGVAMDYPSQSLASAWTKHWSGK